MSVPLFATSLPGETIGGLIIAAAMHVVAGTVGTVLLRRAPTTDRTTA